jgi:hypothetical protein
MVQSIIDIGENEDRIINIIKAKYGLKNKSQAVSMLAKIYEDSFLEPELKPEYTKKLEKIQKEASYIGPFNYIEEFDKHIKSNA